MRWRRDESGVSAVIGTSLVLGITVTGIVAVMFWGTPLITDLQDRNAQATMVSELLEVRDVASKMNGAQNARIVGFNLPGGEIELRAGSQLMVSVDHDPARPTCDLRVTGWTDGDDKLTLTGGTCGLPAGNCAATGTHPCIQGYRIDGAALVPNSLDSFTAATGVADFATALDPTISWAVRLTDASGAVAAEAWIFASDELAWRRMSGESDRAAAFVWGTVLSSQDDAVFAEAQPHITEDAFRVGDYFVRIPVLAATKTSLSGTGSHSVYMSLAAMALDVQADDAYLVRFDFSGERASDLCNTWTLRNGNLATAAYGACTSAGGIYSTLYTPATQPIKMELVHARIDARLVV